MDVQDRNPTAWGAVVKEATVTGGDLNGYLEDPVVECHLGRRDEHGGDMQGSKGGVTVMCPAQPEKILDFLYGASWRTPLYTHFDTIAGTWKT